MIRYVGPIVAVSLLALCGCLAYPYGGYYGYNGYGSYGGYPSYGYPYSSGAPYCAPSYGYSYPYESQYGYGYGYSPGVVVPAPAPPVAVENPPYVIDEYQGRTDGTRRRHLARERWRNRFPNDTETVPGDQVNPDQNQNTASGDSRQWRRDGFANRQMDNSGTTLGNLDPTQRFGSGARNQAQGDFRQRAGTWQGERAREQFMNRGAATQPQVRTPSLGSAPATPQMRQTPLRQPSGPAATPQMRQSPMPRAMMAGAASGVSRPQVGQVRPQTSGQVRTGVREARQRPQ